MENSLDGFQKYPTLRNHPLKTAALWLRGRIIDGGYDRLWRVGDKLYDLSDFTKVHPGGREWLEITRGTDITEAFHSSHLSPHVHGVLAKYYVKPAQSPRNSPYTFEPDGFYLTLKERVHKHLSSKVTREEIKTVHRRVAAFQDRFVFIFLILLMATARTESYLIAALTGVVLLLNMNCSHNYYHKKDNWRMYCFDLSLLSSYEWRITHAISHHTYTNTVWDFELAFFEPYADFRVRSKNIGLRYLSASTLFFLSEFFFFIEVLKRIITVLMGYQKLRPENLLPLAELLFIWLLGCPLVPAVKLWLVMHAVSSWFFVVIAVIAAHHHPDMFHSGDGHFQYGNDWGLGQLDACRDRNDVDGVLLAELTVYGNHVLHHLFPTLDHGVLDIIRPVFQQTCQDFKLPAELSQPTSPYSQWQLLMGMIKQLARVQQRPHPKSQ